MSFNLKTGVKSKSRELALSDDSVYYKGKVKHKQPEVLLSVKIPKTVRNTAITVTVLVLVFVVGATVYVLISDQNVKPPTPSKTSQAANSLHDIKPVTPPANAPEGVAIESLLSPVAAGQNTTFDVRTNAGSTCTITAVYNQGPSRDSGLSPKTADEYGFVSWTWTVDRGAPAGTWPVTVTCVYHGRSGVLIGNLQVTK